MYPAAFISPAYIVLLVLVVVPLVYNLNLSVNDELFGYREFIGWQHYRDLLGDSDFLHALGVTVKFAVADALGSFLLGLIAALVLASKIPWRNTLRVLVLLPWVVPYVITGILWRWMLHPMGGVIPNWMTSLGLSANPVSINNPDTALGGVLLATIWRGFPFAAMMLLAGLESIDEQLYEAAAIDGANRIQLLFRIVLPLLSPVIAIVVLLRLVWSANAFDVIYMMTGGGPMGATETSSLFIYRTSFQFFNLNKGAAASFIQLVLFLALAFPYIVRTGRQYNE